MTFQRGNQFWNLRSKHGRDKLFASPELMWDAACEYFQWIQDNPLIEIDYKGKDAERVEMPHIRPYTYQGLCMYLDANVKYFNEFAHNLEGKNDELSCGFSNIVARIRETIYRQKFEGASCGFYNATIISRDLGLRESIDQTLNDQRDKSAELIPFDITSPDAIKQEPGRDTEGV
jgi:DNA-packaging protein gp3